MSGIVLALAGFGAMLALIVCRAPIALSMLVVGAVGYTYLSGWNAFFSYMKTNSYHQFANYTLSVVPLFILMGALAERSGIAKALLKAAESSFGRFRGGLAMAVIAACTAFGAICGSSVATTATFGRAALPELQRYKYDGGLATGTIAVGGTLGILIPPSVILVVYAITTEQNIAKLFQAALIPGLMAAVLYCVTIAIVVRRNPRLAPPTDELIEVERAPQPWWPKVVSAVWLVGVGVLVARGAMSWEWAIAHAALALLVAIIDIAVMPAIMIALVVVGGIYGGVFTPTEGAAVGAVTMLVVGVAQRKLTFGDVAVAIRQTAEASGMIFLIILGAEVFGAFLSLTRMPTIVAETIGASGLSPYLVLTGMLLLYILLGAVMDELAMILLTLPVFFPVVQALDFGIPPEEAAIWFGILVLIVVGIGLTAPPIGLNVFVISAIAKDVPIGSTYRSVLPFIVADILRLAICVAFPVVSLWLVRALN